MGCIIITFSGLKKSSSLQLSSKLEKKRMISVYHYLKVKLSPCSCVILLTMMSHFFSELWFFFSRTTTLKSITLVSIIDQIYSTEEKKKILDCFLLSKILWLLWRQYETRRQSKIHKSTYVSARMTYRTSSNWWRWWYFTWISHFVGNIIQCD